jgi:hypothetical protein
MDPVAVDRCIPALERKVGGWLYDLFSHSYVHRRLLTEKNAGHLKQNPSAARRLFPSYKDPLLSAPFSRKDWLYRDINHPLILKPIILLGMCQVEIRAGPQSMLYMRSRIISLRPYANKSSKHKDRQNVQTIHAITFQRFFRILRQIFIPFWE